MTLPKPDKLALPNLATIYPVIFNAKLAKSSGNPPYDSAVERAILKAHTLPVPTDPALFNRFRELRLTFCPKEELCK